MVPSRPKKEDKEKIRLHIVQRLHDGGIRQRYVPDDGLVRKSVYETRHESEVWRKRTYTCVKTEDGGIVIPRKKCAW